MKAILLVAAMLAGTPASSAQPRWIPYPANPAWEVYGTDGPDGVFRYTSRRLKAEQPIANYGVQLSPQDAAIGQSVMGTDDEAARLVMAGPTEAEHADDESAGRPRPPDRPPNPLLDLVERWGLSQVHPATWILIGCLALLFGGFLLFVIVAGCVLLINTLFPSRTTP